MSQPPLEPLYIFLALNRPDAKDTDIENIRDILVDSLFSFLVTLGNDVFRFHKQQKS